MANFKWMRLLVSGALPTVERHAGHPHLGVLVTPRTGNSWGRILATGMDYACDNDCFQGLDRAAFIRFIRRVARLERPPLWVAAPDVVGDAAATLARFRLWRPVLEYYGLPVALVAQDGLEARDVPWDQFVCLFIGGTDAFKDGPARALALEAKRRGKLVHVGRVNSERRERLYFPHGLADTMDGGRYSMFPDTYIPPALQRLAGYQAHLEYQARLDLAA